MSDHAGDFPHGDLTSSIIGAAIEVHRALGPGLLESAYVTCLCHDLEEIGLVALRRIKVPLIYKGVVLTAAYEMDVLVENLIVLEVKAVDKVLPIHEQQLLTYLKLSEKPVGLILNFNVAKLTDGLKRVVNTRGSKPVT